MQCISSVWLLSCFLCYGKLSLYKIQITNMACLAYVNSCSSCITWFDTGLMDSLIDGRFDECIRCTVYIGFCG